MIDDIARSRAVVVHPVLSGGGGGRDPVLKLDEATGLAQALDLDVVVAHVIFVRDARAGTLFGLGKVDEVGREVAESEAQVVVVDAAVTPVQQRNLEKAWNAKVLDRHGLILEIFGRRARTKEGRLQVELARLTYEKSRLVRTWTHLERQRGGRGFLAGPGETQLEADRRVITDRMTRLKRELEEVRRTRGLHRAQRKKAPFPLVALVGYTNAGKSTLFNALTDAKVLAKDMLFATLDPTLRGVRLPSGVKAMLADTVGFISDLPPELVEAFQATLEEVREADLLVHVRDVAHPDTTDQAKDVETILQRLGAGGEAGQAMLEVWNKIDRLDDDDRSLARMRARRVSADGGSACVPASAVTGEGLDDVLNAIDDAVSAGSRSFDALIEASDGKALAWLHEHGAVQSETHDDEGRTLARVRLGALAAARFRRQFEQVRLTVLDD